MAWFRLRYDLSCGCRISKSIEDDDIDLAKKQMEEWLKDDRAVCTEALPHEEWNKRGQEAYRRVYGMGEYKQAAITLSKEEIAGLKKVLEENAKHKKICKVPRQ